MGILERTKHVVRADLNDRLKRARNPEAVLATYLQDLKSVQTEAANLRATEAGEGDALRARLRDLQHRQQEWESKARTCLKKGEEELARSALERRMELTEETVAVQEEVEHHQASLNVLDESISSLKLRIQEVTRKQRELRFKRQVLQARSELQAALSKLQPDQDGPVLEEADASLQALESRVEAGEWSESHQLNNRALKLEAQERERERELDIEGQLEALRKQLKEDE
jgi:phage shock protein A